jgi:hypothetical protein
MMLMMVMMVVRLGVQPCDRRVLFAVASAHMSLDDLDEIVIGWIEHFHHNGKGSDQAILQKDIDYLLHVNGPISKRPLQTTRPRLRRHANPWRLAPLRGRCRRKQFDVEAGSMINSSAKRLKSRLKGKSERQTVALAGRVSMATVVAVDTYAKENTITRSRACVSSSKSR